MRDYLRINGQPYAVGESAERQGLVTQPSEAARYPGTRMVTKSSVVWTS